MNLENIKKIFRLYPKDKNAPFAKYMVGMSYLNRLLMSKEIRVLQETQLENLVN